MRNLGTSKAGEQGVSLLKVQVRWLLMVYKVRVREITRGLIEGLKSPWGKGTHGRE